jgi:glutamate N-acetyltransferase/amino-acid N-acetyltransferase
VNVPLGYRFAAAYAGIRKKPNLDLALMVSDHEATAAGVFTRNLVRAAPVVLCEDHLERSKGRCRAIIVNAGNANCATPTMMKVARATARATAKAVRAPVNRVLVSSTGVIGEPLDENLIIDILPALEAGLSPDGFSDASLAIMTTDTVPKIASAEVETAQGAVRIAGMAKGAGMIHPNMATMLSYIFTDAAIPADALQTMLKKAVGRSFNRISVDSDTSTNDTVLLLANGASGVAVSRSNRNSFEAGLAQVAESLAVAIAKDGEGARKLVTIDVEGAATERDADTIARAIANSPLVKTALAGADPNWGRFLSSAGASGAAFNPSKVDIYVNGLLVCRRGFRADFDESEVQKTMEANKSHLRFHIRGGGQGQARFWTCDMTEDYIRINAEYRT